MDTAIVILAAGKGTRMKSNQPKVLHELGGLPLYYHSLSTSQKIQPSKTYFVTDNENEAILKSLKSFEFSPEIVVQGQQLGTGHAVKCALDKMDGFDGLVLILYGDTPFVKQGTLDRLISSITDKKPICFLGFNSQSPGNYGRMVLDENDSITRIIEYKDLQPSEENISLCNSGIVCGRASIINNLVAKLDTQNASGEYYLTDIAELARSDDFNCTVTICDEEETIGVNTQEDLANAEKIFQTGKRKEMMENGVTLQSPETTYFSLDTIIHNNVFIEPNIYFGPGVNISSGVRIRSYSYLEYCTIGANSVIGPFARIRENTNIGENCKIGNFVEIKKTQIKSGTKISHLSYVGDADIGENTNIGAGTIFCNYDGISKHKSTVGDNSFIGSNTILISPVNIGDDTMTAAGSVINQEIPDGTLGISRVKQKNIVGYTKSRSNKK